MHELIKVVSSYAVGWIKMGAIIQSCPLEGSSGMQVVSK